MSTNMISINSETQEGTGSNFIEIFTETDFIQPDSTIKNLELNETQTSITVNAENAEGIGVRKFISLPKSKDRYKDDDAYNTYVSNFLGELSTIARRYKGENYSVSGSTFVEVVQKWIADITPSLKSKKVAMLLELVDGTGKYEGKIFTNIARFKAFADKPEDLKITPKHIASLKRKLAQAVQPDNDPQPGSGIAENTLGF